MFSIPLELPEFEVIKQIFHKDRYLVHVEKKTIEQRCPYCGFVTTSIHDGWTKMVRDMPVFNKPLYLIVKVNRYYCDNCDELFTQTFESIGHKKRQTHRYREYLYERCIGTTIQDVSKKEKIAYSTLERIFYSVAEEKEIEHKKHLENHLENDGLVISLDEVSVKKGHQYETVLMDTCSGSVIGMEPTRSKNSTKVLLTDEVLTDKTVHTVVIDMWEPFQKAALTVYPSACIVVDKYHVVQKVNQALDEVRKNIPGLKKSRFKLLKGMEKLKDDEIEQLNCILEEYPELYDAYFLKETFRDFYRASNYDIAHDLLEEWIDLARNSPLLPFRQVAKTLEKWKAQILQYFLTPYTNNRIEGTNHKIKNIKRRSFGYRNPERFRLRVFLECTGTIYDQIA